jgi:serine/threonine-protein kinase
MLGIGQRIGNYRVRRKLGQGGMGAVYEVVQEEIGRQAAIKILHPEYAKDGQSIQRFFNEARAVNIIHHPGLVGIFESGRLEDGGAYIIMEYLDGQLLAQRLEKTGALPQSDALHIGRQIASALSAAHAKGIVHRDLKPDNIMLVPDPEVPEGERIKIFDFGIAKLRLNSLSPGAGPSPLRTQTGLIMGTPTHMAPEQCRGTSGVDGKADVYSLGVILFQMIAGHPPFLAASASDLMSMHLRDKPPRLRKLVPSASGELGDLVHVMLSKDPESRPEMEAVVARLSALGARPSRRTSTERSASSASVERPKLRGIAATLQRTLQQAVGQTLGRASNRSFLMAIAGAALLVVLSGAVLFQENLASLGRSLEPGPTRPEVNWFVDSEPEGAAVVRADTGEVLGTTPWSHVEAEHGGILRVYLQRTGYRDTTVILNYNEPTHQKVPLEPVARAAKTAEQAPEPEQNQAPVQAGADARQLPTLPPTRGEVAAAVPPTTAAGQPLRWEVSSRPPGAAVVRAADGRSLGKTPWTLEQPAQNGILKLRLRLTGYQDTSVILDLSSATRQTFTLPPTH